MPAAAFWSDDRIAELRKLWAEGLTSGEIGERFGMSRSAIMGKVHRLGLAARKNPVRTNLELFEVLVDLIAEDDLSFTAAASRVPMHHSTATRMWADMCRAGGWQYA